MDFKLDLNKEKLHLTRNAYGSSGGGGHPARHIWNKEEKIDVRILPWFSKDGTPQGIFCSNFLHFNVLNNGRPLLCNKADNRNGSICPVCDWRYELWQSGDEGLKTISKEYWPRKSIIFQGFIRGKEDEGVRIFFITENDHRKILNIFDDGDEDSLYIASLSSKGSYINVGFIDTGSDFLEKEFSLKPKGINKPCELPTAMKRYIAEQMKKNVDKSEAAKQWIVENGYDLSEEFCAEKDYLPPAEISKVMKQLGIGGKDVKLLKGASKGSKRQAEIDEVEEEDLSESESTFDNEFVDEGAAVFDDGEEEQEVVEEEEQMVIEVPKTPPKKVKKEEPKKQAKAPKKVTKEVKKEVSPEPPAEKKEVKKTKKDEEDSDLYEDSDFEDIDEIDDSFIDTEEDDDDVVVEGTEDEDVAF